MGFFPVDKRSIEYLVQTGRDEHSIRMIESYLKANMMFSTEDDCPSFSEILELDLSTVTPCVAGKIAQLFKILL